MRIGFLWLSQLFNLAWDMKNVEFQYSSLTLTINLTQCSKVIFKAVLLKKAQGILEKSVEKTGHCATFSCWILSYKRQISRNNLISRYFIGPLVVIVPFHSVGVILNLGSAVLVRPPEWLQRLAFDPVVNLNDHSRVLLQRRRDRNALWGRLGSMWRGMEAQHGARRQTATECCNF